jgi:hypothetical protein
MSIGKAKKERRPISRFFWNYLRFIPNGIRAAFIRSKFEVNYDLPKEIVLKLADSEDEIEQALRLVHDSYVELNYMDPDQSQMRFTKFHALPSTVILVAKWEDEVIGTISIIPDSALGLPVDTTWNISKYRENGKMIAEISSLSIKKTFRMRRGQLLLPLCKIMFKYSSEFLKLDGIVIATTQEVEPFYTDVLLFDKVDSKSGKKHQLVKDNPSTCCFLTIDATLPERYKAIYSGKSKSKDLYNFFLCQDTPNIRMPKEKLSLNTYNIQKNISKSQIMKKHPGLTNDLSIKERQVIRNLDSNRIFSVDKMDPDSGNTSNIRDLRFEVRIPAKITFASDFKTAEAQLIDCSNIGFQFNLQSAARKPVPHENIVVIFKFNNQLIHCTAQVKWTQRDTRAGCQIAPESIDQWTQLIFAIQQESILPKILPFRKITG